jgi:hypothetical protein
MKEWVRGHLRLVVAVALVLEWAVLVGGGLALGRTPIDAIINAAIWTVISGMILAFELRRRGRTKARLDAHGQIMVYMCYPDSLPGSLSGIWNMGIAKPDGRSIQFQPAVYDTLEPSGRPIEINVIQVLPERRPITSKERKYVGGIGIQVMSLITEKGKVDIAGSSESLAKLVDALEGTS